MRAVHAPDDNTWMWASTWLVRCESAGGMVRATIGPKPMHQEVHCGDAYDRHCLRENRAPVHYVVQDQRRKQDDRLADGPGKVIAEQPDGEASAVARQGPQGPPTLDRR